MNKVIFNYENQNIEIQCKSEDKIEKIFQSFGQKINVDFGELIFYYNGSIINPEFKLNQIENSIDKERRILNILAYKKNENSKKPNFKISNEIICPKCGENICIDIQNFKLFFSDCKNGHNINNISFSEFFKNQFIDINKIKCDICKIRNKGDSFDQKFFYCLECKSNLCLLCNSIHNETHKIVKYEQKNYYCKKHFSNYVKYCDQCKKNMCIQCEKEHKTHKTFYFGDLLIDKENYINEINSLKKIMDKFQDDINSIINLLINFSENINCYYKIADNIIKNYNLENLNFLVLKNITTFSDYNQIILRDLNKFINEKNLSKKFDYLTEFIQNKEKEKDEFLIENMIEKKYLNFNSEITTLIPLNNQKDLAVCFLKGSLSVFDIKTLEEKLTFYPTKCTILDIINLDDNIVCISCWDKIIRVIEFQNNNTEYKLIQELKGHKDNINCLKKVIYFKDAISFCSSANDGTIILWKYNKLNKVINLFGKIKIYKLENLPENSTLVIEGIEESIKFKKLICGIAQMANVYFCELNDLSKIEKINVSVNRCIRALKIIKDDILIVAGNQEINIVKIYDKTILYAIRFDKICEFNCIFQRKNGNILITEFGKISEIREFQFNEKTFSLNLISSRVKDFKNYVTTIAESVEGDLIFAGYDCKIKYLKVKNA